MNVDHLTDLTVYPRSAVEVGDTTYFLARSDVGRRLGILGDTTGFEGTPHSQSGALLCPLTPANAAALRARLPWLCPVPLGLQTSAGFGDRLGVATPGHVQAVRAIHRHGSGQAGIAPIFAQQSVRENARTGRTPQQVLDDAMWGVFQEGWREPWGADADHLKTPADVNAFVSAGYTFYTIDPGDHVDNAAHTDPESVLQKKVADLPWDVLESSPQDLEARYVGYRVQVGDVYIARRGVDPYMEEYRYVDRRFQVGDMELVFDKSLLLRAACKYGRAVAHTVTMYRHLVALMEEKAPSTGSGETSEQAFELEVSVDETETPTSVHEHFYVASELRRLGVTWVSLAPRFVGRFEKGVDYIGDLIEFETEMARHAAVARYFGGYKLSLHSGSDKFSVYPIAARHTDGLVHLKTAGTSYLEALRVVAKVEPGFFREILGFARDRYETDRATYHVSAQLVKVPIPSAPSDGDLPDLLDQFDARQVLHVTFGSVLDRFGARLQTTLQEHEEVYDDVLNVHFCRHLAPFADWSQKDG